MKVLTHSFGMDEGQALVHILIKDYKTTIGIGFARKYMHKKLGITNADLKAVQGPLEARTLTFSYKMDSHTFAVSDKHTRLSQIIAELYDMKVSKVDIFYQLNNIWDEYENYLESINED